MDDTATASSSRVRSVHVLAHTHWDREWYEPYAGMRLRLVELVDDLLPRLETDTSFAHFQLDGQMAAIDDYLEVRPGERARIARLNELRRIAMGPWYTLPDEFLVSGETLVRDLQLGIRAAEELGGAMRVGYLPDMFGHVAQMPQILSLFGFRDAVVWRGVPASMQAPAFWWASPDGTRVRAEYLPSGYFNGSNTGPDPDDLVERIDTFVALQGPLVGERVLWMAGMDHEVPPPHLPAVVAAAQAPYTIEMTSLEEYLRDAPTDALPTIEGELRSGARANLLMGVASNRVDVKIAAAQAERSLERLAEPLDALWQVDAGRWRPLLDIAWREVIRNAAHDSICACSHDEVVDAVLHRYAEATRTARGVAERAVTSAAQQMARAGTYLLNPSSFPRSEVVEVEIPDERPVSAEEQLLEVRPAEQELHVTGAADAPLVVAREMLAEHPGTAAIRVEGPDHGVLRVHLLPSAESGALDPMDALALVGQLCGEDPDLRVSTVLHRERPTRRVLLHSGEVAEFGWSDVDAPTLVEPVRAAGSLGLANGEITVEVDPATGTFSVDGIAGMGRLVDDGDVGDTYNWCPPDVDTVVSSPADVVVDRLEHGPMRGRIVIDATYELPELAVEDDEDRWVRTGAIAHRVVTTLELRAGEPFVRVEVALDNRSRDHRLRAHFPLPERSDHSLAECAYAVVRRPLHAEGGPNEWGVPTQPSRRFVTAGGLTITHEGLCEYELVDLDGDAEAADTTAGELALTLLRSTGWLSRGPMASRPLPAGPEDPLEGAQALGPITLRYAVSTSAVDPYELADRAWSPLLVTEAPGGGHLPPTGSWLEVRGAVVDALLRDGNSWTLRVHEDSGSGSELTVADGAGQPVTGQVVDLLGVRRDAFEGTWTLRPHEILTVSIPAPDGSGEGLALRRT